jgi:hypothetical protein
MNLATVIQELLAVSPTFGSWARSIENAIASSGGGAGPGRIIQSFYTSVPITTSVPGSLTNDPIIGAAQAIILGGNSRLRVRIDHSVFLSPGAATGVCIIKVYDGVTEIALSQLPLVFAGPPNNVPGSAMYESAVLPAGLRNISVKWQMSAATLLGAIDPALYPMYLLVEELTA